MIYIPIVLIMGLVIGSVLGARAVRAQQERRRERMRE